MQKEIFHKSVMLQEVLAALDPKSDQHFIDATLGAGGHAEAILERIAPDGILLGIERDPEMLALACKRLASFGSRFASICARYDQMREIAKEKRIHPIVGVLFDCGISSWHLEHSGRGFSFLRDEPLDMRFNPKEQEETAAHILRYRSREELARIFEEYGEEPRAASIADLIVRERKHHAITTTNQLVTLIEKIMPRRTKRIHMATKVFQALRIAVNRELELLEYGLSAALDVIASKGKIAVITFHGLEARIVKRNFQRWKEEVKGMRMTKHAIAPSRDEIATNPRARSAHLYCFQHI